MGVVVCEEASGDGSARDAGEGLEGGEPWGGVGKQRAKRLLIRGFVNREKFNGHVTCVFFSPTI